MYGIAEEGDEGMKIDSSNYQKLAEETSSSREDNHGFWSNSRYIFDDRQFIRLLHAGLGLCTEVGEFQDHLKRHIFYNEELDESFLIKELGDILWYVAEACNTLNISMDSVMSANIAKLKARYPDGFNDRDATNRDLEAEDLAAVDPWGACLEQVSKRVAKKKREVEDLAVNEEVKPSNS